MRFTLGFCWFLYILFSSGLSAQALQLKTESFPHLGESAGTLSVFPLR
jgi:hypothetical protein